MWEEDRQARIVCQVRWGDEFLTDVLNDIPRSVLWFTAGIYLLRHLVDIKYTWILRYITAVLGFTTVCLLTTFQARSHIQKNFPLLYFKVRQCSNTLFHHWLFHSGYDILVQPSEPFYLWSGFVGSTVKDRARDVEYCLNSCWISLALAKRDTPFS